VIPLVVQTVRERSGNRDSQLFHTGVFGRSPGEVRFRRGENELSGRDGSSLFCDSSFGRGVGYPQVRGPYDKALHVAGLIKHTGSQQQLGKATDRLGAMMPKEGDPRVATAIILGIAIAGKEEFGDGLAVLMKLQKGVGAANRNFEKNTGWKDSIDGPRTDAVLKYESKLGELIANYENLDTTKLRAELEKAVQELK